MAPIPASLLLFIAATGINERHALQVLLATSVSRRARILLRADWEATQVTIAAGELRRQV